MQNSPMTLVMTPLVVVQSCLMFIYLFGTFPRSVWQFGWYNVELAQCCWYFGMQLFVAVHWFQFISLALTQSRPAHPIGPSVVHCMFSSGESIPNQDEKTVVQISQFYCRSLGSQGPKGCSQLEWIQMSGYPGWLTFLDYEDDGTIGAAHSQLQTCGWCQRGCIHKACSLWSLECLDTLVTDFRSCIICT